MNFVLNCIQNKKEKACHEIISEWVLLAYCSKMLMWHISQKYQIYNKSLIARHFILYTPNTYGEVLEKHFLNVPFLKTRTEQFSAIGHRCSAG